MRIAVVGASVGGVAACEALRSAGYDGELVVIGQEPHVPYDRPPLSKQLLLGTLGVDDIALRRPEVLDGLDVDLRLGVAATGLDLPGRELELSDGTRLTFDGLLAATGSRPRRLPGQPNVAGVHLLRQLDDALALRAALAGSRRLVIVGAGFIGLEVAAGAATLGLQVTVLEAESHPMARVLGAEAGELVAELHRQHGVEVHCDASVEEIETSAEAVCGVLLQGGERVPADVVVVGVGATPNTEWVASGGLRLRDGIICDDTLRAADRVYAIGDVARWPHPLFGSIRVEHWTTAGEHARTAALNLLCELNGASERRTASEVPYFWSDQFGVKLQMAGWTTSADVHTLIRDGTKALILYGRDNRLVAALAWNWPKELALHRRRIAARCTWEEALARAPAARPVATPT